jgi:small subunit ribosomal protein S18
MRRGTKSCLLCESGVRQVNYKDDKTLGRVMTEQGKILPRRMSGVCARHQRQLGRAVKRARFLALVPYVKGYSD